MKPVSLTSTTNPELYNALMKDKGLEQAAITKTLLQKVATAVANHFPPGVPTTRDTVQKQIRRILLENTKITQELTREIDTTYFTTKIAYQCLLKSREEKARKFIESYLMLEAYEAVKAFMRSKALMELPNACAKD